MGVGWFLLDGVEGQQSADHIDGLSWFSAWQPQEGRQCQAKTVSIFMWSSSSQEWLLSGGVGNGGRLSTTVFALQELLYGSDRSAVNVLLRSRPFEFGRR
eukprot:scaffold495441_cov19-Prasinocladus_malaysianus.AAC.1